MMTDTRLARLHERLAQTERALAACTDSGDSNMREAFPLGPGTPGNASSRRMQARAANRIDTSINRAVRAVQLQGDAAALRGQVTYAEQQARHNARLPALIAQLDTTLATGMLKGCAITDAQRATLREMRRNFCRQMKRLKGSADD